MKLVPPTGYFIDSNLLILLVAGKVDKDLIGKHRRLKNFSTDDYQRLLDILEPDKSIYVTPNTLTEASNLLPQHKKPEPSPLLDHLRHLIHESKEIVIASEQASSRNEFKWLGLTDAVLLEAITPDKPLLTADLELYAEGTKKDVNAAFYFQNRKEISR